ncbi:ATP-binding cassette long-chain fatty acid transporter pxa1 [Dipsacomyces acuminosporus]|nr:ATP-binding cassette long-chain fatty acid transporter pxa1 [Dipsacomyces acuminosporus]
MAVAGALSSGSMRSLRGGANYGAGQWTESDERERQFDKDAAYFPASLIDKGQQSQPATGTEKPKGSSSGKLDRAFFLQLRALVRIMIPSLASKEVLIIVMHSLFLILRTWLSVVVAELDGKIVKHLVRGQGRKFLAGLLSWFAIAVPATYTNSMIRFLESKLALAFRTRLTQYVHDLYLNDNLSYYKLLTLDGRISNPDQFITTDIARFCNKLSSFLSNLGKPTLDTIIFNIQLIRGVGLQGTVGMFAMYMATASLLRAWTPPFGKMAAAHAKLEGEFRANHSRVITNAEEIAFYRGEKREAEQLQSSLSRLLEHARSVAHRKISHVVLEDMVIKYTWSAFGYLVCALPFFLKPSLSSAASAASGIVKSGADDGGHRTQQFITNKRILVNLSDAGGRVMYSIKEVMELTGYTSRVYSLISTLHALRREEYEQPAAQGHMPELSLCNIKGTTYEDIDGVRFTSQFITNKRILVNLSDAGGRVMYSIKEVMELTGYTSRVYSLISTLHALRREEYEQPAAQGHMPELSLCNIKGTTYEDIDGVRFTSVPIVAPSIDPNISGELLVRPLTWEVRRGQHWMIAGPNGVGKTSVLRVLSGLWPAFAGVVERPEPSEIIYIPQRPYLSLGTLRDQIIYPHTYEQMQALGRVEEELMEVLHAVHLSYLPAREGGFSARKEWKDVLSGGEKQRINLARLFYHLPRFAVLDECTSAVSADVEGLMYEHAKRLGITLITISHRPALYKYHTFLLRLGVNEAPPTPAVQTISTISSVVLDGNNGSGSDARAGSSSSSSSSSRGGGGGGGIGSGSGRGSEEHSTTTESWETDIGDLGSVDELASSGVPWDVIQLSATDAGTSSSISPLSSTPPSFSNDTPAADPHVQLQPQQEPADQQPPVLASTSVSTADLARQGAINSVGLEIEQLRGILAVKRAQAEGLRSRLEQVQQELTTAVL